MKKLLILLSVALGFTACEPTFEEIPLKDIVRLEPGDKWIGPNHVRVAHIVCYEPARCEQNNDTIVSAYFDELGRVVELWRRFDNYGELYEYADSSGWASKKIVTDTKRRVYTLNYTVNPEYKLVTRYMLEGEDSLGEVDYRFNDKGLVTQFGPDENNLVTYYQYGLDDLMVKRTVQFPDTTFYWDKFGRNEINTAYKIVEDYYYTEGKLDSSVKAYFDPYGNKFNEPTIYKYSDDGLLKTEDGKFKYNFFYEKY